MAEHYVMLRSKLDSLIKDYGSNLCDLLNVPPGHHMPSSPGQVLVDKNLSQFLDSYYLIKDRLQEKALSVALLALTKSGKSTFFNALLGDDCMPTGTVPETARICRIVHNPLIEEPILKDGGQEYKGTAAVRQRLHELNNEVRQREHCILDEEMVTISAPLAALAAQPPMPTELHLIDTPGPNEAGEEGLKYQVERLLDGVGVLVYLLDCTKLKTQDERGMFQRLQEINPQLLQRLSKRLFFLVNKKDMLQDMSEDDIRSYVAEIVTSQIGNGEFQLDPSQVLLMSAKTGLYSRMILENRATAEQRTEFAKLAFGQAGWKRANPDMIQAVAPELFEESGIAQVEERLLKFLYSFAGRLQMLGSLDDITRHLSQVINSISASHAALAQDYNSLSARVAGMTQQLEGVKQRFHEVQQITDNVEADVIDEIKDRMQKLKERLFEQVDAVLSETQSATLQPRWKCIWAKIRDMLLKTQQPHSSETSLQNILLDLYLSVDSQMNEEVATFWHDLEEATNMKQYQLFDIINKKLQELSHEVEGIISEKLDVVLQPANITMQPPTNEQYHEDLRRLFSEGIARKSETREVEYQVENTVIEKHYHVPLCKLGEYYVARPVVSTEVAEVVDTIVSVDTEKVKDIFMSHVDATVNSSIQAVRAMVRRYVRGQLDTAKARLDGYCTSYSSEMAAALQEDVRDEDDRKRAMQQAAHNLAKMKAVQDRVELLSGEVEGAHSDEEGDFVEKDECYEMELPDVPGSGSPAAADVPPILTHQLEDSFMSACNDPDHDMESVDSLPEVPTHAVVHGAVPVAEEHGAISIQSVSDAPAVDEDKPCSGGEGESIKRQSEALAVSAVLPAAVADAPLPEEDGKSGGIPSDAVSGSASPSPVVESADEVAYPEVQPMEPLPRQVKYPEVQPVNPPMETDSSEAAQGEGYSPDHEPPPAATVAEVEIQMEPLPVSLTGSSSGPFNYEEAFHDCMSMSIREDRADAEVEEDYVLVSEEK